MRNTNDCVITSYSIHYTKLYEKQLRKLIMKIKTNSLEPGEPKDIEGSTLYDMYKAFATPRITSYNVCYTKLLRLDVRNPLLSPFPWNCDQILNRS